jgi:hypothetical protein
MLPRGYYIILDQGFAENVKKMETEIKSAEVESI